MEGLANKGETERYIKRFSSLRPRVITSMIIPQARKRKPKRIKADDAINVGKRGTNPVFK